MQLKTLASVTSVAYDLLLVCGHAGHNFPGEFTPNNGGSIFDQISLYMYMKPAKN